MQLPQRGVLIRLLIYIPLIGFFGWRAMNAGCAPDTMEAEPEPNLEDQLAPHRKTITLPDGTQQEIVELTPQEAEAILGHPIPDKLDDDEAEGGDAKADTKPETSAPKADAPADAKADPAPAEPESGSQPVNADPPADPAKAGADAKPGAPAAPAKAAD